MPAAAPERLAWTRYFTAGHPVQVSLHIAEDDFPAHDHAFVETVLICGGSGTHRHIHGERRLGAGDAFLMRPGAWHAYAGCRHLEVFNCCFDAGLLGRELGWMSGDALLGRLLWSLPLASAGRGLVEWRMPADAQARCRVHLEALLACNGLDPLRHRSDLIGRLTLLLGEYARHLPATPDRGRVPRTHPAVQAVLAFLDDDLARGWTLAELATLARVEGAYLVRIFRRATGLPPMAYLARRRGEVAAGLLAGTDLPVGQVGARVGWLDACHFARCFRRQFGMPPQAWRQRAAGGGRVGGGTDGHAK